MENSKEKRESKKELKKTMKLFNFIFMSLCFIIFVIFAILFSEQLCLEPSKRNLASISFHLIFMGIGFAGFLAGPNKYLGVK